MENGEFFKDLRLNGKPLAECELTLECNHGNYRLYVDKEPENFCFYSIAVEFLSCADGSDVWGCDDLVVEQLFNSTAYFDGVRHLEFNREAGDMSGYIYYPDLQAISEMLAKLREIELEICRDCDK